MKEKEKKKPAPAPKIYITKRRMMVSDTSESLLHEFALALPNIIRGEHFVASAKSEPKGRAHYLLPYKRSYQDAINAGAQLCGNNKLKVVAWWAEHKRKKKPTEDPAPDPPADNESENGSEGSENSEGSGSEEGSHENAGSENNGAEGSDE